MQSTLGNYQEVNVHKVKSLSTEKSAIKNGKYYWRDYWRMCKHEKNSNGSFKSKKSCRIEYERVSS